MSAKAFLLTLLVLCLLVVGVYLVHGYQVDRQASLLLDRANAVKEEEPETAVRILSQYVRFRPHDGEALATLADLLRSTTSDRGAWFRAYHAYGDALALHPTDHVARRRAAELAYELHQHSEVMRHVDYLREHDEEFGDTSELVTPEAMSLWFLDRRPRALAVLLEGLAHDGTVVDNYETLLNMFDQLETIPVRAALVDAADSAELDEEILKLFPKEPIEAGDESALKEARAKFSVGVLELAQKRVENDDEALSLLAASSKLRHNDVAGAREQIDLALAASPNSPEVLVIAFQVCLAEAEETTTPEAINERIEAAHAHVTAGASLEPVDPIFHIHLAQIELQLEREGESREDRLNRAEAHLRNGLEDALPRAREDEDNPRRYSLRAIELEMRRRLVETLVDREDLETAEQEFHELERRGPRPEVVGYLKGRLHFANGRLGRAFDAFEACRDEMAFSTFDRRLVDKHLALTAKTIENATRHVEVLERAMKEDPEWQEGRILFADALRAVRRHDEAREQLALAKAPRAGLMLAQLILTAEQDRRRRDEHDADSWKTERRNLMAVITESSASSAEKDVLLSQVHVLDGELDEARTLLRRVCKDDPENVLAWAALAQLELSEEGRPGHAKCMAVLATARSQAGHSAELDAVEIRAAQRLPKEEALEQLRKLEKRVQPGARAELALAVASLDDENASVDILRRAADKFSNDLKVRITLVQRYVASDQLDDAKRTIDEIRGIEGEEGPVGNFGAALVAVRMAGKTPQPGDPNLEEAAELLRTALKSKPTFLGASRMLAGVYAEQEFDDKATKVLEEAVDLGNDDPATVKALLAALARSDGRAAVASRLEDLVKSRPRLLADDDLAVMTSRLALVGERRSEAIDIAKRTARRSGRGSDLLWLATAAITAGPEHRDGVVETFEAVIDDCVARNDTAEAANVCRLLVGYLRQAGDEPAARARVETAVDRLDELTPLHIARLYDASGDSKTAEEKYRQAVTTAPDDDAVRFELASFLSRTGSFEAAERELATLDAKDDLPRPIRFGVDVQSALLMGRSGRYTDSEAALGKLDRVVPRDAQEEIQYLQTRASILSRRPTLREQGRLIEVYERLSELRTPNELEPEQSFRFAMLLLKVGSPEQKTKGLSRLNGLAEAKPDNLTYHLALASHHISEGRPLAAAPHVQRFIALEPDSFRTTALRAKLSNARGERDRAVSICRKFIARDPAEKALESIRGLLSQRKVDEALRLMNRLPADHQAEVRAHVNAGETDEAFAIIRTFVNEDAVVARFLAEQHRLVGNLLEELDALDEAEEEFRVYAELIEGVEGRLTLASFLGRRESFEEAHAICEAAWQNEPNPSVGLVALQIVRNDPDRGERLVEWRKRFEANLAKDKTSRTITLLAFLADVEGDYERAEVSYERALKINPNDIVAMNNLAWMYAIRGRELDEAERRMNGAIALVGEVTELLDTRAYVNSALERHDEAIADIQAALDVPSPSRLFHAAAVYHWAGRRSEAIDLFEQARDEGFDVSEVHPLEMDVYETLLAAAGEK